MKNVIRRIVKRWRFARGYGMPVRRALKEAFRG